MRKHAIWAAVVSVALVGLTGCGGPGDTIINTQQMTPEEIEKMVAEDKQIEDEESQGKAKPPKKK